MTLALTLQAAYAGTWVYIGINTQSKHESKNAQPGSAASTTTTVNTSGTVPYASMTASADAQSSLSAPALTSGGGSAYQTASFLLKWKQSYVGEVPPAVIYHHHKYDYSCYASKSSNVTYGVKVLSAKGGVSFADNSAVGTNLPGGTTASPFSDSATGSKLLSFSYQATGMYAWQQDSVDAYGLITFRSISPDINSPIASSQSEVWITQTGVNAMSMATSGVTDAFYFTDSSTTNYTNP